MVEGAVRVGIIFTDPHLSEDNCSQIIDLVRQACDIAKASKVKRLICLGDVFQSRKAQPLVVLKAFEHILDMIKSYDLVLHVIPGNHDKTNYESKDSFLDQYAYHPACRLYREFHVEYTEKLNLYFVPYFKEDTVYWDQLKDQMIVKNPDKLQILFSHCAITGSVNNDGSEVKNGLRVSNFKAFDKVYLGHYHNYQQPAVNIYHLSSICQNNFGEDDEKGFWILTDDGEVEFRQSQFKHYKKIVVNLETTSVEKMRELIEENKECVAVDNVRLEFVGTEAKLSGVDRNAYLKMGFDVKTKSTEISTDVNFDEVAVEYTESSIITEFEEFCALNHLEKEEGLQYLINN